MQDKHPLPYIAPLLSLSFMVPEGSEGLLKAMYTWVPSLGSQLAFFFFMQIMVPLLLMTYIVLAAYLVLVQWSSTCHSVYKCSGCEVE